MGLMRMCIRCCLVFNTLRGREITLTIPLDILSVKEAMVPITAIFFLLIHTITGISARIAACIVHLQQENVWTLRPYDVQLYANASMQVSECGTNSKCCAGHVFLRRFSAIPPLKALITQESWHKSRRRRKPRKASRITLILKLDLRLTKAILIYLNGFGYWNSLLRQFYFPPNVYSCIFSGVYNGESGSKEKAALKHQSHV